MHNLLLKLHLCFSLAMPCRTTLTEPCGRRGKTSAFWYLARAARVKQRPQRRSSSITQSRARQMSAWLHSWTACCSPIPSWRLEKYCFVFFFSLLWIGLFSSSRFLLSSFYSMALLHCVGLWQCQNIPEWQLQPIWKVHGHSVWLQGEHSHLCLLYL